MTQITSKKAKHRLIFEQLQTAIRSGRYIAGQRLPSETQLVERFGTSRPTVARAMRDLENAGIVSRRVGSGTYVRPDGALRNRTLGLLVPGLEDTGIFEPVCAEIARVVRDHNFALLWGNCGPRHSLGKYAQMEDVCRQCIEQKVAGVFFAPLSRFSQQDHEINLRVANVLEEAGIQIVLLDRDVEDYPSRSKYDLVGIDNHRAGYLAADHLVKLGCHRIDFVVHHFTARTGRHERAAGYQSALLDHGISPQPEWIRCGDIEDEAFFEQLLADRAEAYVCANDLTAGHLMQRLLAAGVRVPEEVRIVGVDDVKFAQFLPVPLTTVHQPCREIGAAAVVAMIKRIADPAMAPWSIQLPCWLVVRRSCGAEVGRR